MAITWMSPPPLRCTFSRIGSSLRHGGHHEAQKLSTTTLPRLSPSRIGSPSRFLPTTSGAASPTASGAGSAAKADCASRPATSIQDLSIVRMLELRGFAFPAC